LGNEVSYFCNIWASETCSKPFHSFFINGVMIVKSFLQILQIFKLDLYSCSNPLQKWHQLHHQQAIAYRCLLDSCGSNLV
jgi:hypothetical protein